MAKSKDLSFGVSKSSTRVPLSARGIMWYLNNGLFINDVQKYMDLRAEARKDYLQKNKIIGSTSNYPHKEATDFPADGKYSWDYRPFAFWGGKIRYNEGEKDKSWIENNTPETLQPNL